MKFRNRQDDDLHLFDEKPAPAVDTKAPTKMTLNEIWDTLPHRSLRVKSKEELTRQDEIDDLDFMLSQIPNDKFNRERRKEIEAHRRELVKAQQKEEREKLRLAKEKRREEKKQVEWAKKSVDAETMTKIAEEHQKEALARDRRRRAFRRKVDRVFDIIGKIVFAIILIVGVLCISNESIRDKVSITFNNVTELIQDWTDGEDTSSNKTVDEFLETLGQELNEANTVEIDEEFEE